MNLHRALSLSSVAVALVSGCSLMAQTTTGGLGGRITDASGKPIAGARVALESPALFQTRVATTNERGEYRAQLLPVGNYTIKVSANDYLGRTVADFRIGVGTNLTLDVPLKPIASQGATVEVVAAGAMESKTEDKISVNFSAEQLLQLPTSRSFDGALALAPGVTGNGTSTSIRGGSAGGFSQVLYRIDGIDVGDTVTGQPDALRTNSQLYEPLPDSIEDVQVVLSALNARNGRTQGGQVNVVTRSGSNDFSGSIRTSLSRPSWTTNLSRGPVDGDLTQAETRAVENLSRYTDITFSGPVIKDRLWFYVGTRLQPSKSGTNTLGWGGHVEGNDHQSVADVARYPLHSFGHFPGADSVVMNRTGAPAGFDFMNLNDPSLSDYGKTVPKNTKYEKYEGKLTGMVTPNHTLSLTLLHDKAVISGMSGERSNGEATINREFMGEEKDETNAWTLGWNGTFGDRWFVEARVFKSRFSQGDVTGPTTFPYSVQSYLSTGDRDVRVVQTTGTQQQWDGPTVWYGPIYSQRSSASITPAKRGNESINVNVRTFQELAGQHEIDLGFEQFQTIHQFGRERNGDRNYYNGGFLYNPATRDYRYATMYTAHEPEYILDYDDQNGNFQQYWETMRGPGAHLERFWSGASEAKNKSRAFWVNDSWTLNANFNVMLGARANAFQIFDTDGSEKAKLSILEPRFQVKWNPDGAGKEILTFSYAKLASAYSDEMAAAFRSNGWYTRTVHGWKGLPGQPGIDDPGADPLSGVRWVDYNTLTDLNNYDPRPYAILDQRQTYRTQGLEVPYALETTLGYQRNYETGYVRITGVERKYKKEWVSYVRPGWGLEYMTLKHDPSGLTDATQWGQNLYFLNSKFDKTYRSIELAWQENYTTRLSFGGNITYSRLTGRDGLEYYNYAAMKQATGTPDTAYAPEGLLSRDLFARAHVTYVHPLGKGHVSISALVDYAKAGVRSLRGSRALETTDLLDEHGDVAVHSWSVVDFTGPSNTINPTMNSYYGGVGAYQSGSDWLNVNLRLQGQFPLKGKLMLISYLQVENLFNRIQRTSTYGWASGEEGRDTPDSIVAGVPLSNFARPWGTANNHTYYNTGRTFTEFSIGLKF